MTALTVETAKNVAIAVAVGLVALMLVMAWLIKNIVGKLLSILVVGGLALGIWTQRSSLQQCADKVKARSALGDHSDVTCTFLGSDIKVLPASQS